MVSYDKRSSDGSDTVDARLIGALTVSHILVDTDHKRCRKRERVIRNSFVVKPRERSYICLFLKFDNHRKGAREWSCKA